MAAVARAKVAHPFLGLITTCNLSEKTRGTWHRQCGEMAAPSPKYGASTYVQEIVSGAAALCQEMPALSVVCKTLLGFEKLVETARSNKEELGVLLELCAMVTGTLQRDPGRADLRDSFEKLAKHVKTAHAVATLCNEKGLKRVQRFALSRRICNDIVAAKANVINFTITTSLVLTDDIHVRACSTAL